MSEWDAFTCLMFTADVITPISGGLVGLSGRHMFPLEMRYARSSLTSDYVFPQVLSQSRVIGASCDHGLYIWAII